MENNLFVILIKEILNGITAIDLLIIACIIYTIDRISLLLHILIEEFISLFSKKYKENWLLNLEWYCPGYLIFRSDITGFIPNIRNYRKNRERIEKIIHGN